MQRVVRVRVFYNFSLIPVRNSTTLKWLALTGIEKRWMSHNVVLKQHEQHREKKLF